MALGEVSLLRTRGGYGGGRVPASRDKEAGWGGLLGHLALSSSNGSFYYPELCLPVEGIN